jgi:hypothetical protein
MGHGSMLRVSVMLRAAALQVAEQGFFNSPIAGFVRSITAFDTPNWEAFRPGVDKIIHDWESLHLLSDPRHGDVCG